MLPGHISPDGRWAWDGSAWVSTLSPDGLWRWDGYHWVPLSASGAAPAQPTGASVPGYPGAPRGTTVYTVSSRDHVVGRVEYAQTPPVGGQHAAEWLNCGIYDQPVPNENAVHSLEHGAIWITYRPGLSGSELDQLKSRANGVDYLMLSPYPGLKTKVSLQSWGHQLFVDSTSDSRIDKFIKDLKHNVTLTPEPTASCVNPSFKTNPRAPGTSPSGAASR
jgi:hypothetical protein